MKVWKPDLEPCQGLTVEQLEAWDDLVMHVNGYMDDLPQESQAHVDRKLVVVRCKILDALAGFQRKQRADTDEE